MIEKEEKIMTNQPDFSLLNKFDNLDIDAIKQVMANAYINIWKIARLLKLEE